MRRRGRCPKLRTMSESYHEQVMRQFAERLKRAREAAGFEHAENLADALGLDPNRYRKYERPPRPNSNSARPDLTTLVRICNALKISVADLLPTHADKEKRGG